MREVTRDQHIAHALQFHQQAVVPGCVARCVDDDHRAIAKHILVTRQCFQLARAADPVRKRGHVGAHVGLGRGDAVPVALADQQCGAGERRHLTRVVRMIVADAHVLDLFWLDVDLRQLVHDAHLGCGRTGRQRVAGVPQKVFVATLDEVAAKGEHHPVVGKGPGVVKAGHQIEHRRTTVKPSERHFGRRCGG